MIFWHQKFLEYCIAKNINLDMVQDVIAAWLDYHREMHKCPLCQCDLNSCHCPKRKRRIHQSMGGF